MRMTKVRKITHICTHLLLLLLVVPQSYNIIVEDDNKFGLIQRKSCGSSNRNMLLASLMNGEVIALNLDDGAVLWSIQTGSKLLSSSLSSLEVIYNGIPTRLVPSLDGSLFRFRDEHFEPLPFTAETLLSSSFKLPGDSTMVGSKELRTVGLDPNCGQLLYKCDKEGCDRSGQQRNTQDSDILVIKHMTHTVRAASVRDGVEKWNFSVGHHELTFSDAEDSVYTSGNEEYCHSKASCQIGAPTLKFSVSDGTIMRLVSDNSLEKVWQNQLEAPISKSWLLRQGQLEHLDLMNPKFLLLEERIANEDADSTIPPPSLYIGVYEKQVYLQPSKELQNNVSALASRNRNGARVFTSLPRVQWAPYLTSSPSRTPSINYGKTDPVKDPSNTASSTQSSRALALLNPAMDYPYDQGFYLSAEIAVVNDTPSVEDDDDEVDSDWVFEDIEQTIIVQIVSLQFYWKEVLAISLFSAVLLNGIFYVTRAQRRRLKSKLKSLVHEDEVSDVDEPCCYVQGKPATLPEPPAAAPQPSPPPMPQYHSRYQSDFMHIQCLGKGGFGVVFQARNSLDECDYAIKRITLPNSDDAKEKVTREVKALAKLDHPNIVRYFQSWFETPPPGWQEDRDKIWESTEKFVPTPVNSAYPGSFSRQQSLLTDTTAAGDMKDSRSFVPKFKFDDSKDTSASFGFPANNRLDDSLEIVFTSRTEESAVHQPFHKYAVAPLDQENSSDSESSGEWDRLDDSGYHKNNMGTTATKDSFDESLEAQDEEEADEGDRNSPVPSDTVSLTEAKTPQAKLFLYIQMQLCKRETLRDYLNANTLYRDKSDILLIFRQICDSVEYIHSQGLIHRDLKPTNIFFATDNTIKVGDFGLVTALSAFPEDNSEDGVNNHTPVDQLNLTNNVGTKIYMSPEQIAGRKYNSKVDIYALGLVFFEMKYPFSTMMERVITLLKLKKNDYPERFTRELPTEYKFVKWMLARNPSKRPSITDVLNSEVMSGSDGLLQAERVRTRTVSRSSSND